MLRVALVSLVRHGLTVLAGYVVAKGILTEDQASGAVREAVDIAVPILMVAGAVGWSVVSRKLQNWKP